MVPSACLHSPRLLHAAPSPPKLPSAPHTHSQLRDIMPGFQRKSKQPEVNFPSCGPQVCLRLCPRVVCDSLQAPCTPSCLFSLPLFPGPHHLLFLSASLERFWLVPVWWCLIFVQVKYSCAIFLNLLYLTACFILILFLFVCFLICAGSSLLHAESLVVTRELLVVTCGI